MSDWDKLRAKVIERPGFTYHSDTVPFGQKIRAIVKPILKDYADDFGESGIFSMMQKWKVLSDYSIDEIAEGWASNEDEDLHTAVMNAIAWFALEEIARQDSERMENPRKRIGAKKPLRKSERTGEKPSKKLVQRRKANVKPGYFPNPISESDELRAKGRYVVQVMQSKASKWLSIAIFRDRSEAEFYAKKFAERHAAMKVRVTEE